MITTINKEELFKAHLRGESIAAIARRHNLKPQTIEYWFRRHFGYRKGRNNNLCPVIEEYLASRSVSKRNKQIIQEWYSQNLFNLVAEGRGNARPAFVEHKLNQNIKRDNAKLIAGAISARGELENAYDQSTFNQIVLYQRSRFK
ncbi:hypothetical protein H6G80_28435 [Nostoc sp. FACHB-87]|uniref:helix-turn-helix domain-containing protein n=1 Tax=Nostocaceae TaxID=1162 RepID=UPI0016877618|nr:MULTISPECIES: helix-turn-helix domain containing protein [Nostocaceae]MBD2457980.1 hypothetical protein [Nostoc sp. FACHB-87]MBD2479243.1 hypothetical protein [Anabaena sp. FACHB-83]